MKRLLAHVGLDTPELRAWALYDNANSAFYATIIVAVFPPFFSNYAAAGLTPAAATERFAWTTTIAVTLVALMAPVLGAIADYRAMKKRLLGVFVVIGVTATLLMATIERGQWWYAAILFMIGNVGVASTLTFYDSLLPHLATPERLDRASTAGYAIGFLGSGLLLLLNIAWILSPATFGLPDATAGIRLSFLSVGIWWLLFSIPLLRRVPEPPPLPDDGRRANLIAAGFSGAWRTFNALRGQRDAFWMLVAFLLYNDGIQTIIRMGSVYGSEIGIDQSGQVIALVLVQLIGVPCAFLFGAAADRVGAKTALYAGIGVYILIALLGYVMTETWHFFVLAILVGTVQGGTQALSRSVFARMIPRHKSSEYFGFFAVFEKFGGVFGPLLFAASVSAFGSSRTAVISVVVFFIAGALVLRRVDIDQGQAQAEAINRAVAAGRRD
jgi:MFS transporter, UMF1 family